jgi:hypothetical protein
LAETLKFEPHSDKQERIIFSDADITVGGTGTQWGKSLSAALWMKRQICTNPNPDNAFLVGSPTYPILNQSALPYLRKYIFPLGTYNETKKELDMGAAGILYIRTATDPESVVGIPNTRAAWLDEAGKLPLYYWENVQARLASKGGLCLMTTSPYALNWIYKDLIRPAQRGERPDVALVQAASWENPYHSLSDPVKREHKRATMDPRRFKMIFGGEWDRMTGLVYDCWSDAENLVEPHELPQGTLFYGGADWGYEPDPAVLKVRAVTPEGKHYGVSEFVKTRQTISDLVQAASRLTKIWNVQTWYCDPSQPGHIEEFNRAGCPSIGANNEIRYGIDLHYELIKTRRYLEFRGRCPASLDERETYHYPEPKDLGPDENSKETLPVDQHNHCMDVDRYITVETFRRHEKFTPRTATGAANLKSRLDYLKRPKREGATERWS